jgi:hypothetical protein
MEAREAAARRLVDATGSNFRSNVSDNLRERPKADNRPRFQPMARQIT